MTTVTFLTEEARIIGFDVSGHSGYADAGEDIVCAAITSAVRLVDATVNDLMGLCASVEERKGRRPLKFRLPGGLSQATESTCQDILTGLMVYLVSLHEEYPENVLVKEKSNTKTEA
jgi:uncharacterized protein YsxB (DUF464 family)